jgi:hypothetical protein
MRKREQQLWDTMRGHCPLGGIWLERVENMASVGMPDVRVTTHRGESWVELKAPILPKRAETRLLGDSGLNPAQINWHMKATSFGMKTYILIRWAARGLALVPTWKAQDFPEINSWPLARIQKEAIALSWPDVYKELLS